MIKSAKKFYLFIAFIVALITLTSCIVVNNTKVHLENTEFELREGQTADAVAWATKDGQEFDIEIGYQSYDPTIATYINGKITAIKAGVVHVKAYAMGNPKIYTVATVTVVEDDSQKVSFDYEKQMIVGDTQTIKYDFEIEKDRVLTFTSSNNKVATVDKLGNVTALAKGQTTITTKVKSLYDQGKYKEYKLTINVDYVRHSINYVLNGGVNNKNNPSTYATEEASIKLASPRRAGFTFLGWFDNPRYEGNPIDRIAKGTTGALTLYARWSVADYTIEYELNGGENHSDNPDGYSLGGLPIVLSEPTKKGYTFIGWYNGNEHIREINEGTTGNIYVEAKWELNTYKVTYDLKGGKNASNPVDYNVEQLPITLKNPTRSGYQFTGWLVNGKPATGIASETTGDLKIEATWKIVSYKITLNTFGGTLDTPAKETYTVSDLVILPNATKNGYTFLGWYNEQGEKVSRIPRNSTGNKTYNAKWDINTYSISTTLNGGTPATSVPTTYTVNDETIVLPTVEKVGYTFLGWYEGTNKIEQIESGSYRNYNLEAKFEKITYKVTYNDSKNAANSNPKTFTVEDSITLVNLNKDGYTFKGWFSDENLSKQVTVIEKGTTGDIKLYAKWEKNTYTVTFDSKGGSTVEPVKFTIENSIASFAQPTRNGYNFNGWYNAKGEKVEKVEVGTIGNMTLVADWTATKYTITFDANGGSTVESVEFTIEDSIASFAEPTRNGYNFNGWYNANGEKVEKVEVGTTGDMTLVAAWTATKYTITFDSKGGSTVEPVEFTIEDSIASFAQPTRNGYNFNGWYNDKGQKVEKVEVGTTGDMTLVAAWTATKYTITFDSKGGSTVEPVEFTIEDSIASFAEPTRNGYNFNGWYNDKGQKVEKVEVGTTGDMTLVAAWTSAEYNIEYVLDGGQLPNDAPTKFNSTVGLESLPTPTKNGYDFDGWYIGEKLVTSITAGTEEIVTLTVHWKVTTYSITYELDGGENNSSNKVEYTIETPFTLNAPSKAGHNFLGWYDNEEFKGDKVTEISGTGSLKLYAKWESLTFEVTFDSNGGSAVDSQKVNYGSTVEMPNQPTKDDYRFVEWQLDGERFNFDENITDEIVLTAKWELIFENGTKVIIAALKHDSYWALRASSNNSTNSDKLDAKDLSTNLTGEFSKVGLNDPEIVWTVTHDDSGYYLQALNGKYVSDVDDQTKNEAYLSDEQYALHIIINDDGTYSIYSDSKNGRQLELNNDIRYDFFAFYKKTQYGNLVIENYIEPTDEEKLVAAVENLTIAKTATTSIQLPNLGLYGTTIVWTSNNTDVIPSNQSGEVTVKQLENDITVVLTATITINGKSAIKTFDVVVTSREENEPEKKNVATFTLGEDKASGHNDGSSATSYTETVNGYVLTLENLSKVFSGANDKQGNGCLKLGTNGVAGSFTFTVSDDITKVIIYVAKYKTNSASITINEGNPTPLEKNSDDGEYDVIKVDTSTNKTISFTVSSGYRAMVNTIEFYGNADTTDKTDEEKLAEVVNNLEIPKTINVMTDLPKDGIYGTTITWKSSKTDVVSINDDGSITVNPSLNDTFVDLTATIQLGDKTDTKVFTVKVVGYKGTTSEYPYSVDEAINVAKQLETNSYSDSVVYVKGVVKTITYSEQHKNFIIVLGVLNDSSKEFTLYGATIKDDIEEPFQNDTIVASGYITNYNGNTPELANHNDVSPRVESVERGESSITFIYDEDVVLIDDSMVSEPCKNGEVVIFEVLVAIDGYYIESIKVNGYEISSEDESYEFIVKGNSEVVISTKAISAENEFNITWESPNATISETPDTGTEGSEITFTVTPDSGYIVTSVKVNDVEITADADTGEYIFVLTEDSEVVVVCQKDTPETEPSTYTYTLQIEDIKNDDGEVILGDLVWNCKWDYTGTRYVGTSLDSSRGFQIGSKNNPAKSFELSTEGITGKIVSITVNASTASGGDAKLTISVNGVNYLESQSLTTSATDYGVSCDASGKIVISFEATSRAYYIKSITIEYEE